MTRTSIWPHYALELCSQHHAPDSNGRITKAKYVNAFLAPAVEVWQSELRMPLRVLRSGVDAPQTTTEDITAVIQVSGGLEGVVFYGFMRSSARSLLRTLMALGSDEDMVSDRFKNPDELANSAVGEVANMISGNALTLLAKGGYTCTISPPEILKPQGAKIESGGKSLLFVAFRSSIGPLYIRLRLDEAGTAA